MPGSHRPHPPSRLEQVFAQVEKYGPRAVVIARELGLTMGQVMGVKRRHRARWDQAVAVYEQHGGISPTLSTRSTVRPQEEITRQEKDGELELRSYSDRIKTVEDLLGHIDADLNVYEVSHSEATKNEVVTKHPETGEVKITEYFRVWVRLRKKEGSNLLEAAEAMLAAALRERTGPLILTEPKEWSGVWQVIPVADPHFGKYSWRGTTGYEDYDLDLARAVVHGSGVELMRRGDRTYQPSRRTLAFLGDVFHYDTPHGTTTGGTPLERDGRMPKMVDVATDTILELIETSAATCPTDVVFVRGNHDEALTTLLQKTVSTVFRSHPRITVDTSHTHRKYLFHDGTLLGFTHGDKARKRLPSLMPFEARAYWGQTKYCEYHSGHTHAMRAEYSRPAETIDGVLVRVAPALCPPDDWHADHGFVGALRAMESFFYRPGGGLLGQHIASPEFHPAER